VLLGRVLLVEDEPTVLDLGRDVLVGAGAIVTTSTSIEDAKERMRKEPFNVIIMNGRMSAGGAQEMYDWTAATCSGLEKGFLFTFAGNVEEQTRAFLQEHGVPVLVKPFEVADLISQVRAVAHTKDQSALKSKEDKASATNAGA
jgi:two-component system response regulator PilR (NtrC family)